MSLALPAAELPPLKIASVADDGREDDDAIEGTDVDAAGPIPGQLDLHGVPQADTHLDELFERLAWWVHTRKLYGAPRGPVSLLGKLRGGSRPLRNDGGPDAACSADLAALYIAVVAQPADALDRIVFELHYFNRVKSVKEAAGLLKIGRQHWYTLLRSFRRRAFSASREILAANQVQADKRD